MSKLKDVYMHQNTLAALANVAPHMSGISSHAAQRLVSLFDMLAKRYCASFNVVSGWKCRKACHLRLVLISEMLASALTLFLTRCCGIEPT